MISTIKSKKCEQCGEKFKPFRTTQRICSTKCAVLYASEKEQEKRYKDMKVAVTDWRDKLKLKIQEIVRLIDFGQACLARGTHGKMNGGHIFSVGSNKTISLNLHNIHRQCTQSNHFQNEDGLLREKLTAEYGQDYFKFISELRRCEALKYSNDQYHQFYQKSSKIALRLKKNLIMNSVETRIKLRNEINEELGIYELNYCIFKL